MILFGIGAGQLVQIPFYGFDIPLLDVTVGVAVLLGLYHVVRTGPWGKIIKARVFQMFVLLMGVLLLSLLINIAGHPSGEMAVAGLFWCRLLMYGLMVFIFWAEGDIKFSVLGWLGLFLTVAVVGFLQLGFVPDFELYEYLGWDPHQFRLLSTFLDPNLVGIFLGLGAGLGLLAYLRTRENRIGTGLATLIILAAVFLTFSRSALLAVVVISGILAFVLQKKLFVIGLGLLVVLVLVSPRMQERLSGIWQIDITVQHRLESWDEGLRIFKDHPLLGVGYNTLMFSRADYVDSPEQLQYRSASGFDSSLLTVAATSGILGLIAWLGFVGVALASVWRRAFTRGAERGVFSLLFIASTASIFFSSFFVNAWLYPPILATWFIILGLGLKENYGLGS